MFDPQGTSLISHVSLYFHCSSLIQCVKTNKETDSHWFQIQCNPNGTSWTGTCWYFLDNIRYEFQLAFEIPITYPSTPVELRLPELDGLTSKMYRSGKICQTLHFQPMWKSPQFGIVHSLALSLGPWLAAELPDLIGRGVASRFAK